MSSIKIIQDPQGFQLSSKWQAISQQNDKIVDQNGKAVGAGYAGQRFKVLNEAKLSESSYGKRRTKAIVAIIFSFGIAYCCSKNIKSLLAQKHRIFISPIAPELPRVEQISKEQLPFTFGSSTIHSPLPQVSVPVQEVKLKEVTLEEAESALNNGLVVPESVRERLRELRPKFYMIKGDKDIDIIGCGQFFSTFTIPESPDLVFKAARSSGNIEQRYKNTVSGKQAIMKYGLDLLEMPDTVLLSDGDGALMVERRLPFKSGHYFQQDLYYQNQDRLKPIALQLARLICEIGDDDARVSNYPLFEKDGTLKAGVIDLEWGGNSPVNGFMGDNHNSPGLIGMMPNEALIEAVIKEGEKLGLKLEKEGAFCRKIKASEIKGNQLWEIERYHKYQEFFERRKIQTGDEPMMQLSEIDQLGLDLEESWVHIHAVWDMTTKESVQKPETFILREAVEKVVKFINKKIEAQKDYLHIKQKRSVHFPMNDKPYSIYQNLGVPEENKNLTFEETQQLWMTRIFNALREKGFIFGFEDRGNHGFIINC